MRSGKYQNKKSVKSIILALVLTLLLGCGIGGTLAWLMDTTDPVTNTFTVGDVNIELKEHDLKANGTLDESAEVTEETTYKVLPGTTQPKDPFVRVKANSEDSWIFVQVKEVNNAVTGNDKASKYVEWAIDNGIWTHLGTEGNIHTYVMTDKYTYNEAAQTYNILLNETVSYNQHLTKANIKALDTNSSDALDDGELPKLIFKAFAVQAEAAGNAADAWNQIAAGDKLS